MAIEIDSYKYLFRPEPEDDIKPFDDMPKSNALAPVRYNPLHDLESIWWIGVRTIFTCGVEGMDNPLALEKQKRNASLLFPRALGVTSRLLAMMQPNDFADKASTIFTPFHTFAIALESCRRLLVNRYKQAERGPNTDETAFLGVHDDLSKRLSVAKLDVQLVLPGTAQTHLREGDVEMGLQPSETGPSSLKRSKREGEVDRVLRSDDAGPSSLKRSKREG
jgi:hypothetical protein